MREYTKPKTAEMIIAGGGSDPVISEGLNAAKIVAEHIVTQSKGDRYYATGSLHTFIFIGFKP